MGGFSSGGNPLLKAGATMVDASIGLPVATAVMGMAQAGAQQRAQQAAVQQTYELQAQSIARQQQQQARERQDLLRRTMAAQRARLGAMGVAGGGSADALISGLQQQAVEELADLGAEYGDRQAALDARRRSQQEEVGAAYGQRWGASLVSLVNAGRRMGETKRQNDGAYDLL